MPVSQLALLVYRRTPRRAVPRRGFRQGNVSASSVAVQMWNGWIWVNLEPATAPSLEEQVAVPGGHLDRYPLSELQSAHRIVYQVEANWKAIVENPTSVITADQSIPNFVS
ncbi:MAG: hypothetical protein ABR609_01715 [Acidimicrobiia bacterium]